MDANYYSKISFEKDGKKILEQLQKTLNNNISEIIKKYIGKESTLIDFIQDAISTATQDARNSSWYFCNGKCYETLHALIDAEINSTLYMLRILSEAQFDHRTEKDLPNFVSFRCKGNNAWTGVWRQDKNNIEMLWKDGQDGQKRKEGQLVLGLGPSASGKSFWGKYLTKWLNLAVWNNKESCFLVVDGGKYRELSVVYQSILQAISSSTSNSDIKGIKGIKGLMNLAMNGTKSWDPRLWKKSGILFDTDMIKKPVLSFLCKQKVYPNLYVPETLSTCDIGFLIPKIHIFLGVNDCEQKIQQYKDITGGSPVILNIWQHEEGGEKCPFKSGYQCKGCIASGREREIGEGKKYSPDGFRTARNAAKIEDHTASPETIVLKLHSSQSGTSILVNHSSDRMIQNLAQLPQIMKDQDPTIKIQYFESKQDPEYLNITNKSTETLMKYLTIAAGLILFL